LRKFQPVTPWIIRIEPPDFGRRGIPNTIHSGAAQPIVSSIDIRGRECRVRLRRRREYVVDPNVKLAGANAEPASAARAKRFGLFDFDEPEQVAEEGTSFSLTAFRGRNLHVINIGKHEVLVR
jgi:hypothetical protein